MYYLPWWMQWAQAIALIVISCLGSWIAYKQVRIAGAKLNLDLYDRRFKVFEATRTVLIFALQKGDVAQDVMNTFYIGVADAIFLFDKSIDDYLQDFGKMLRKFQMLNYNLQHLREAEQARRGELADALMVHSELINAELPILIEKFKPFLRLGDI
jgi:hypothetical protein